MGWRSCKVKDGYNIGLWKTIAKDCDLFNSRGSFFFVSDRRRVKFQRDKWCEDEPLWVSFPSLYVLVISKEAWYQIYETKQVKVVIRILVSPSTQMISSWMT